jgi:glycine cleavage system H lipoate-binding protein
MQGHLGEVVFVELPEPGTKVAAGGPFGNVESVKATSDVNSPISGEVVEVNAKLSETPGLVLLLLLLLHACIVLDNNAIVKLSIYDT